MNNKPTSTPNNVVVGGVFVIHYNRTYELSEKTKKSLYVTCNAMTKQWLDKGELPPSNAEISGVYHVGDVMFGWYLHDILVDDKLKYKMLKLDESMIVFKAKESTKYGICQGHKLPEICGESVSSIWYDGITDTFDFTPQYFGDHYNYVQFNKIVSISQSDLDLKLLRKFMGNVWINGRKRFIRHIRFRTDTSGLSGADDAIQIEGDVGELGRGYLSLYLTHEKLLNPEQLTSGWFEYFKELIHALKGRELTRNYKYKKRYLETRSYTTYYEWYNTKTNKLVLDKKAVFTDVRNERKYDLFRTRKNNV